MVTTMMMMLVTSNNSGIGSAAIQQATTAKTQRWWQRITSTSFDLVPAWSGATCESDSDGGTLQVRMRKVEEGVNAADGEHVLPPFAINLTLFLKWRIENVFGFFVRLHL